MLSARGPPLARGNHFGNLMLGSVSSRLGFRILDRAASRIVQAEDCDGGFGLYPVVSVTITCIDHGFIDIASADVELIRMHVLRPLQMHVRWP